MHKDHGQKTEMAKELGRDSHNAGVSGADSITAVVLPPLCAGEAGVTATFSGEDSPSAS